MTPSKAKQLLPIIAAFADGKTIQVDHIGIWTDLHDPVFNLKPDQYRIKPTTKLRPFRRGEIKCGDEVKAKDGSCEYMINGTSDTTVWFAGSFRSYAELFNSYTMADGSPCGKEEEV